MSYYAGHFDMRNWGYLFEFTSTHAILTPVISIFWSVFVVDAFVVVVEGRVRFSLSNFDSEKNQLDSEKCQLTVKIVTCTHFSLSKS